MNAFFQSLLFRRIFIALAVVACTLAVFSAGVHVGERKARHFIGWSEHYGEAFLPPPMHGMLPFPSQGLPPAHGVFGTILSVEGDTVVVQGNDGVEQRVRVASSTAIRLGRSSGAVGDLKPETQVAVFGEPGTDGEIAAKLIRLFSRP